MVSSLQESKHPFVKTVVVLTALLVFLQFAGITFIPSPEPSSSDAITWTEKEGQDLDSFITSAVPEDEKDSKSEAPEDTPGTSTEPLSTLAYSYTPGYELGYFYTTLSQDEKEVLHAMYTSLMSFEDSLVLPKQISIDSYFKVLHMLWYECPEILQYETGTYYYNGDNMVTSVDFYYSMDSDEYKARLDELEAQYQTIAAKIGGGSDSDRALALFEELVLNTVYNKETENAGNMYGTLCEHEAKCDGISEAYQWILHRLNIPCSIVSGINDSSDIGHAWCMVKLEGSWLFTDVTADVPLPSEPHILLHNAYCAPASWMARDYDFREIFQSDLPLPDSINDTGKSYHEKHGSYVQAGQNAFDVVSRVKQTDDEGNSYAVIQFESKQDYEAFLDSSAEDLGSALGVTEGQFRFRTIFYDSFQTVYVVIIQE